MPDSSDAFHHNLIFRLAGSPSQAVLDGWGLLQSVALREPEALAGALKAAADLDPAETLVSLVPAGSFGLAVVAGAQTLYVGDTFRAWFGDPSEPFAFRRLAQIAQRQGQASGLVNARDETVIAACAGDAETALRWPLPEAVRAIVEAGPGRIVLMGFAPSRDSVLARRAATSLGLTPMESRLAEALLDAPTVQAAAERIGVGYETAREALAKIKRRLGAKRTADIVRRLMTLMCGDLPAQGDGETLMVRALGATPAEARVGALAAQGLTAAEIADRLGVKEATVRGQLKTLYAKAGVSRGRDLIRLAAEAGALAAVTGAAEAALQPEDLAGALRVVPVGERQVAFWDYGPRSHKPLLVLHGSITGRTLPPAFVAALHRRGWRPIVPQRPGFGLTDLPAGDYLEACVGDMVAVLDALKLVKVRVLARDDGAAAAMAFAERHPDRISDGMLVRPKAPGDATRAPKTITGAVKQLWLRQPEFVGLIAEILRRQARTDLLRTVTRRAAEHAPNDRRVIAEPGVLTSIVRDMQAMSARTSGGFAAEQALYARGWVLPKTVGGERWLVAECTPMALPGIEAIYGHLPGVRFETIPDAGLFVYYSDPELIAEMVSGL